MYECYDCGDNFNFYGDCPTCGSENVSTTNGDYIEDEEINKVLRDVEFDDEEFDEDYDY